MRHDLPEKLNGIRIIHIFRSSDCNPAKRSLNEPVVAPEQTVNNADIDQQRNEINHDLPGRVDDANHHIHATSSPSDSGL